MFRSHCFLTCALLFPATQVFADARLTSWQTEGTSRYARIYETAAAESAGTASTTWSRGAGVQSSPTYGGVSKVVYSANWVYIRTTGLATHVMGPWYLNAAKTQNFPNFPSNTAKLYRIPRTPVIPAGKSLTGLGATGIMVNGVSMFDSRDAFSYVSASATDATPGNGLTGDGVWNRDGYHNEGVTFDPALAHQAGNNYHYHAHPIGLRWQLGDHVDSNAAINRYTYFTPINADGTPMFPYTTGRQYYGSPTGGNSAISEPVTTQFSGGPNASLELNPPAFHTANGHVTLTWSAVEGGTYLVEGSPVLTNWPDLMPPVLAAGATAGFVETAAALSATRRFYRVSRTSLAVFDSKGFDYTGTGTGTGAVAPGGSAAAGTTVSIVITLPTTPPNPPANIIPLSITLGGTINGASISRPSASTAQATFVIPAGTSAGAKNIVVTFNPGPTYTLTNGFTIN